MLYLDPHLLCLNQTNGHTIALFSLLLSALREIHHPKMEISTSIRRYHTLKWLLPIAQIMIRKSSYQLLTVNDRELVSSKVDLANA